VAISVPLIAVKLMVKLPEEGNVIEVVGLFGVAIIGPEGELDHV
jgi:hypothetical protein